MRFLTGLLLATILALASCTAGQGSIMSGEHVVATAVVTMQDQEPITELGDGYQMKVREIEGVKVTLIKFPDDKHMTRREEQKRFVDAARFILVKVYGQDAFEHGQPVFFQGPDDGTYFWIHDKLFFIEPLYMGDETGDAIGIIYYPAIRATGPLTLPV